MQGQSTTDSPVVKRRTASLWETFAETARRFPDRQAIWSVDQTTSYSELEAYASRIARALGTGDAGAVAISTRSNVAAIATALACTKLGRVFLFPPNAVLRERMGDLLLSCEVSVVAGDVDDVGDESCVALAGDAGIPLMSVAPSDLQGGESIADEVDPASVAWIAFTSGSTGNPKAVGRSHATLLAKAASHAEVLGVDTDDRLTLATSLSLAASSSNLWAGLMTGACLLPFDIARFGVVRFASWLRESKPTVLHLSPSVFRHLVRHLDRLDSVRAIKFGGEALLGRDVRDARRCFGEDVLVVNGVGQTEIGGNYCRMVVSEHDVGAVDPLPVGFPVDGFEVVVRDDDGGKLPAGEPGQVFVRSAATADAAFADTGDVGYWDANGRLNLVGRSDRQVKIRGQRVSLPQIESVALGHDGVHAVHATVHRAASGDLDVVLFVGAGLVGDPDAEADVRQRLRDNLPAAAWPAKIYFRDRLGVTGSGKLDRAALDKEVARWEAAPTSQEPVPETTPGSDHQSEASDSEELIVRAFSQTLGGVPVGPKDNFFDLGGQSLLAAELLAGIQEETGVDLPLNIVFEAPTPRMLARLIDTGDLAELDRGFAYLRRSERPGTLFCLHHANGVLQPFQRLSRMLSESGRFDANIVSLVGEGMDGRAFSSRSIEDIAARHFAVIQENDFPKPWSFIGFCQAGVVAFELGRRCEEHGIEPRLVSVIDRGAPHAIRRRETRRERLANLARGTMRNGWAEIVAYNRERRRIRQEARFTADARALALEAGGNAIPHRAREVVARDHLRKLVREYRGGTIKAPMLVFASSHRLRYNRNSKLEWDGYSESGVEGVRIEGPHALLVRPQVDEVVWVLGERLLLARPRSIRSGQQATA